MKYAPYLIIFLGLCLSIGCNKWDLDQENFVQVRLLSSQATGLTTAEATAEALDLQFGQITDHGFVWISDAGDPTLNFNDGKFSIGVKESGQSPGFSATISNLRPDTRYRLRAYAVVKGKEIYSDAKEIQTSTGSVITDGVSYVSGYSMELTGHISGAEAGIFAISHGFCWSTENEEPTLDNQFIDFGTQRSGQSFSYKLESLIHNTTYYIRAYALLDVDGQQETHFGNVIAFHTNLKNAWTLRTDLLPVDFVFSEYLFSIEGKAYLLFSSGEKVLKVYDPMSNTVEERLITGLDFLDNENIYLYGFSLAGKGYILDVISRQVWQYDPLADQWLQQASLPAAEPLANALVFGYENKGYFGFGYNYDDFLDGQFVSGRDNWWTFDPNLQCDANLLPGCWKEEQALQLGERFNALSLIAGDQVYLGLGQNNEQNPDGEVKTMNFNDWWMFDPVSQTQTRKKDFPGKSFSGSPVGTFTLKDRAYTIGRDRRFWEYFPATDSWLEKAEIPTLPNSGEVTVISTGDHVLVTFFYAAFPGFIPQIWEYLPD